MTSEGAGDRIDRIPCDKDNNGWTLLHHAIFNGNRYCTHLLVNSGADPDILNNDGKKPFYYTQIGIEKSLARQLIQATKNNDKGLIKQLLAQGANPTIQDNHGKNALDYDEKNTIAKFLAKQKKDILTAQNDPQDDEKKDII